jgi:hypothetical protein
MARATLIPYVMIIVINFKPACACYGRAANLFSQVTEHISIYTSIDTSELLRDLKGVPNSLIRDLILAKFGKKPL